MNLVKTSWPPLSSPYVGFRSRSVSTEQPPPLIYGGVQTLAEVGKN